MWTSRLGTTEIAVPVPESIFGLAGYRWFCKHALHWTAVVHDWYLIACFWRRRTVPKRFWIHTQNVQKRQPVYYVWLSLTTLNLQCGFHDKTGKFLEVPLQNSNERRDMYSCQAWNWIVLLCSLFRIVIPGDGTTFKWLYGFLPLLRVWH